MSSVSRFILGAALCAVLATAAVTPAAAAPVMPRAAATASTVEDSGMVQTVQYQGQGYRRGYYGNGGHSNRGYRSYQYRDSGSYRRRNRGRDTALAIGAAIVGSGILRGSSRSHNRRHYR